MTSTVSAAAPESEKPGIAFAWGVKIPMRDGVRLNATLYRPRDEGRVPAIFTLTPYVADSYHPRALYFAQNGYAFALVDCRGRGNSEGVFDAWGGHDATDGHDVVEWLAAQPWCDGKVAMWGGSYAGFNQWRTLSAFPPHLATIVPAAAAHPGVDWPTYKNIGIPYDIQWATLTSGVTNNTNLFQEEDEFWFEKYRELYLTHRPFADLAEIVGNPAPYFLSTLDHPCVDAFIESLAPTDDEYRRMDLPILTITGHYDADQPGALAFYKRHVALASPQAREKHYLIVGPWDHAGTRTPSREVGGLTFGEAALLDLNALHKAWYDWTMKGGEKPEFLKGRVAYYVTGSDEWKYADDLATIASEVRRYYLTSLGGRANDVFHSGRLQATLASEGGEPDRFVYDPLDTRPAELERRKIKHHLTDQRYALNLFGNGVVYHSEPFDEAVEITGQPRLAVWMSMDVPDTDFVAWLWEVKRDGSAVLLSEDRLRARYRESLKEEKPVRPGEIICYVFDWFTFISRQIAQGSRLRLVLACQNSIHWQKNYNSGGVVAYETAQDARTAHVIVYHDVGMPSRLEIPIVAAR